MFTVIPDGYCGERQIVEITLLIFLLYEFHNRAGRSQWDYGTPFGEYFETPNWSVKC